MQRYFQMIHAIEDYEINYSYNYNSVTFEQHKHTHRGLGINRRTDIQRSSSCPGRF